jgi:hypothetical protein
MPSSMPPAMQQAPQSLSIPSRARASPPEPIRAASIQIGMPPANLRGTRSPMPPGPLAGQPPTRAGPPPKLKQMRAMDVYQRMYGSPK